MRTLILLLGVVAFTQADRIAYLRNGANITGTGLSCVDGKNMPVRLLSNSPTSDLKSQCTAPSDFVKDAPDEPQFGGVIGSGKDSGSVQVGMTFLRECNRRFLKNSEMPQGDNRFMVDFTPDNVMQFAAKEATLVALAAQLKAQDCTLPTVCLAIGVNDDSSDPDSEFEIFSTQDFVIAECAMGLVAAKINVDVIFSDATELSVTLDAASNQPALDLAPLINEIFLRAKEAPLPPTTNPGKLQWPRGTIIYMTRRKVNNCDMREAQMQAGDELLKFIPQDSAIDDGGFVPVAFGGSIPFGKQSEKCLFCGPVTIVVLYDFLGRDVMRTDFCDAFKTKSININCDDVPIPDYRFDQVVPFFKSQGTNGWIRTCYGKHGYKTFMLEQSFYGALRSTYLREDDMHAKRGVGRLAILQKIFGKMDCAVLTEGDDAVNEFKAALSPPCVAFMKESFKDERGPDFMVKLKEACDGVPKIIARSLEIDGIKGVRSRMGMQAKLCPSSGFKPKDMMNDGFNERSAYDSSARNWREILKKGVLEEGKDCADALDNTQCATRAIATLMSSSQRLLVNNDFYRDFLDEDEFTVGYEAAIPAMMAWAESDVSFLRRCPRPDFYKPEDGALPAVWKFVEGEVQQGYYNNLLAKWCYKPVARINCPLCAAEKMLDKCDPAKEDCSAFAKCDPAKENCSGSGSGSAPAP